MKENGIASVTVLDPSKSATTNEAQVIITGPVTIIVGNTEKKSDGEKVLGDAIKIFDLLAKWYKTLSGLKKSVIGTLVVLLIVHYLGVVIPQIVKTMIELYDKLHH